MAITNHERVGKALELLRDGLAPFVESRFLRSNERVGHGAVSAVLGSTPPKRGLYRLWFGV